MTAKELIEFLRTVPENATITIALAEYKHGWRLVGGARYTGEWVDDPRYSFGDQVNAVLIS